MVSLCCRLVFVLVLFPLLIVAQPFQKSAAVNAENDSLRLREMPQIEVIGTPERLNRIPGAAFIISPALIRATNPVSGNEVLRKVAGLHIVDEEGVGLRANIGIRGLDPDRSRTVLMLEDGIPLALAPYGEPEMYYTPPIDRMSSVEIIKGSGSILFGPQTFGGVINYITENPPPVETTKAQFRLGPNGFLIGKIGYGNTIGNTGYHISLLRKQADRLGIVDFGITDLTAKFKMVASDRSVFGVKLSVYNEESNSTYVGLTQPMFDSGSYDFAHPAPDDRLEIRRYAASLTHDFFFTENIRLKTTAFGYTTTRNWSRQDFRTAPRNNETYSRVFGDASVPGGALYFLNRTGNRDRQFEVAGIEPRLSASFSTGSVRHETDLGMRFLYERAFEQRVNGTMLRPASGTLVDDEQRTGKAWSAYIQNKTFLSENLSITPGLRFESFWYERDIFRLAGQESSTVQNDVTVAVIPGIGINYLLGEKGALFAGIHRGFGPPRVKDAITPDGLSENLKAEQSWNVEAGIRIHPKNWFSAELTGFFMHFSNQIIPVSESSGRTGSATTTGLVNGGETIHSGLETAFSLDLGKALDQSYGLVLQSNATFTNATFSADRFLRNGQDTVNVNGNRLPYAPSLTFGTSARFSFKNFEIGASSTYVAAQFADELNRILPTQDGLTGQIPSYFVLDLDSSYRLEKRPEIRFTISAKNLLDERYIVSRRPQGIRLGIPRMILAGFELAF